MSAPLQLTGSIKTKTRISQWGILILFGGLGVISFLQAKLLLRTTGGGETSTGLITQSMQARLNGVSLGIVSYLQNHDPDSLARIKSEGKEASRLLGDLKADALQGGNEASYVAIGKAQEDLRTATLDLLAADHDVVVRRQALKDTVGTLQSLTAQMESAIRSNQLNASSRLRSVHALMDDAKKFAQNQTPGNDPELSRTHFGKAVATYQDLSRSRRTTHWADQARDLFEQCVTRAKDLQKAEEEKVVVSDRYSQTRRTLDQALQKNSSTQAPKWHVRSVKEAFSSGIAYVALSGLLLLAGIFLVLGTTHRSETQLVGPLHEILQCVEAAATGDLARIPTHWSRDEMGQLSQAVGRLISVLARSENLVYHLAALVESSGEAIISHTLDGTILSWNKGAQRIYGYSAEEMKGRSITILSPDDGGAGMMNTLRRIQNGERVQPFETIHQASNGRSIRAFVRVSGILDSTRKVIGASFCAQDLTDTNLLKPKTIETRETVQ